MPLVTDIPERQFVESVMIQATPPSHTACLRDCVLPASPLATPDQMSANNSSQPQSEGN